MGDVAPVISGYKAAFGARRLLATFLGGLRFGGNLPIGIQLLSILLFLSPVGIGVGLTIPFAAANWVYAVITGGAYVAVYIGVQVFSAIARSRSSRISPTVEVKTARYGDDEDADEDITCCSAGGANALNPKPHSWFPYVYEPLLVAALGCGAHFMLTLDRVTAADNLVPYIATLVIGWYLIATSFYAIAVARPLDPHQYSSSDVLGFHPSTRAFYVIPALLINFLTLDIGLTVLTAANIHIRLAWLCLPFFFWFGILPQPDVFVMWILEQALLHGHGGTYAASPARLFLLILFAWTGVGIVIVAFWLLITMGSSLVYVFPGQFYNVIVQLAPSVLGAVLSMNLLPNLKSRLYTVPSTTLRQTCFGIGYFMLHVVLSWGFVLLAHGVVYAGAGTVALVQFGFLIAMSGAWFLSGFFQQLQRPYFANLFSNVLKPQTPGGKTAFWWIHSLLMTFTSCATIGYISLGFRSDISSWDWQVLTIEAILQSRAYRRAWQMPRHAAAETIVAGWVLYANAFPSFAWPMSSLSMQLLILGAFNDRLRQIISNLWFMMVHLLTSFTTKKQKLHICTRLLCLAYFPFSLLAVIVSSLLSAPVIPFLGMPLFIIGFPRPKWHWPRSSFSSGADAAFYRQMMPQLVPMLSKLLDGGLMGDADAGSFVLMRHQGLFAWVQIFERGAGYAVVSVTGLEQQETSCHHAEAMSVDDQFDASLPQPSKALNPYVLNSLTPLGTDKMRLYSVGNMQLTGIIDSPDNLALIPPTFFRVIVWLFAQRKDWPKHWETVPMKPQDYDLLFRKLPAKWYQHCHPEAAAGPEDGLDSLAEQVELDPFVRAMLFAYGAVEHWGLGGLESFRLGPSHVASVFRGEIPPSTALDYLNGEPHLRALTLKAYRYAVKVVFDQAVLGSIESYEQLSDMLVDYEQNWSIGGDSEDFQASISRGERSLFTMEAGEKSTYVGHVYTLDEPRNINIGFLNQAAVRGFWASLALELYYFTNDDDERYSIQAHPHLLRNLTVQAAAPPLGYPVFLSGPIGTLPPV